MIKILLPDTPEMRNLLRDLSVLCIEDNIESIDQDIQNGDISDEKAKAKIEANETFYLTVEKEL